MTLSLGALRGEFRVPPIPDTVQWICGELLSGMDNPSYFPEAFIGPGNDIGVAAAFRGSDHSDSVESMCLRMREIDPLAFPVRSS